MATNKIHLLFVDDEVRCRLREINSGKKIL